MSAAAELGHSTSARIESFPARVDERLTGLMNAERARCSVFGDAGSMLVDALGRAALSGGKRSRPMLMFAAFIGAGGAPDDPRADDVGAAIELLHAGCLAHDDVMDDSAARRGHATVHTEFEVMHRHHGWHGETRRFGEGVAILVGDLAFFHAMRLMRDAGADAQRIFLEVGVDVGMGQYLDLRAAAGEPDGKIDPRLIARYKTGRYTVEGPLHLGAALAGRLEELGPALSDYGRPVGEAYQLTDDLLGAFGDQADTGKPAGDDLRQGKCTSLLEFARARHLKRPDIAGDLLDRVGGGDLTADELVALQQALIALGAREHVQLTCEVLAARAVAAIDAAALEPAAGDMLKRFACDVARRAFAA